MEREIARLEISIHAPAQGATPAWRCLCRPTAFQSTLPRRERLAADGLIYPDVAFQSTLPRRERRKLSDFFGFCLQFQSTLPRRERPRNHRTRWISRHFNPRSRAGSDFSFNGSVNLRDRFQSTLPRRERLAILIFLWATPEFQSTLPRRERLGFLYGAPGGIHFNPRSRAGSDKAQVQISIPLYQFQSTLPRRERPPQSFRAGIYNLFQSTLPRRERLRGPHER